MAVWPRTRRGVLRWAAALLLAPLLPPAFAGTYLVTPVSLTMGADDRVGEFRLINMDQHVLHIQVQVDRWTQDASRNVQTADRDFIVSPPVAEIPPGGTQIVRLGLRYPVATTVEQSYRVMFRELPETTAGDKTRILLDYSVPMFVLPLNDAHAQLVWRALKMDSNTLLLQVVNTGNEHVKVEIHSLKSDRKDGPDIVSDTILTAALKGEPLQYTLAGAHRELKLAVPGGVKPGDRLWLSVDIDANREDIPLTVE